MLLNAFLMLSIILKLPEKTKNRTEPKKDIKKKKKRKLNKD